GERISGERTLAARTSATLIVGTRISAARTSGEGTSAAVTLGERISAGRISAARISAALTSAAQIQPYNQKTQPREKEQNCIIMKPPHAERQMSGRAYIENAA